MLKLNWRNIINLKECKGKDSPKIEFALKGLSKLDLEPNIYETNPKYRRYGSQ